MVHQSKPKVKKRRKNDEQAVRNGSEKKRKRPAAEPIVDENLLRVLTGKKSEHERDPEISIDTKKDERNEAEPENDSHSKPSRKSDPSEEEEKDDDSNAGGKADSNPISLGWQKQLDEAHAKKINVIVLLERANLETVKQSGRSGGIVLLNCDDHRHILKKSGRDANDARPDITHQCLLALMDSPLNKAGRLKVYVRTAKNVLIEIHPQTRIPRTMKRFSGLMAELLEKFKVRGTSGSTPLLKVIRNPITSHLPVGTRKVVCTYNTENIVDVREHAGQMAKLVVAKRTGVEEEYEIDKNIEEHGETVNVLYVIGAMAHGKISEDWADEYICISEYPLSAANVCSRVSYAYESLFGIL